MGKGTSEGGSAPVATPRIAILCRFWDLGASLPDSMASRFKAPAPASIAPSGANMVLASPCRIPVSKAMICTLGRVECPSSTASFLGRRTEHEFQPPGFEITASKHVRQDMTSHWDEWLNELETETTQAETQKHIITSINDGSSSCLPSPSCLQTIFKQSSSLTARLRSQ